MAAEWIGDPQLAAQQFRVLGAALDDSDIRLGFVATGKAGDLAALVPRRAGEPPRRASAGRSNDAQVDRAFHGTWGYRGAAHGAGTWTGQR